MTNFFVFGAIGQCPECGYHRFSGPVVIAADSQLTCHKCGHACSAEVAVRTGLAAGALKKVSDDRVSRP